MLSGKPLPWADGGNEEEILEQKHALWCKKGMLVKSIPDSVARAALQEYFDYVDNIGLEDVADYTRLKEVLVNGSGMKTIAKLLAIKMEWPNKGSAITFSTPLKRRLVHHVKKVNAEKKSEVPSVRMMEKTREGIGAADTIDFASKVKKKKTGPKLDSTASAKPPTKTALQAEAMPSRRSSRLQKRS
jgi:hypothetical protein